MTEDQLQQIRRDRALAWIDSHGGAAAVREKFRLGDTFDARVSQWRRGYSFGPRAARTLEDALRLPAGYFDSHDGEAPPLAPSESPLSPMAQLLAKTFDMLPDDHLTRVTVFQEVNQIIIGRCGLAAPTQTNSEPVRSGSTKTRL